MCVWGGGGVAVADSRRVPADRISSLKIVVVVVVISSSTRKCVLLFHVQPYAEAVLKRPLVILMF